MARDAQETVDQLRSHIERLRQHFDTITSKRDTIETDEAFEEMYDLVDEMDTLLDDVEADESVHSGSSIQYHGHSNRTRSLYDPAPENPYGAFSRLKAQGIPENDIPVSLAKIDDILKASQYAHSRCNPSEELGRKVAKMLWIPESAATNIVQQRNEELKYEDWYQQHHVRMRGSSEYNTWIGKS